MVPQKIEQAMHEQIGRELYSAYAYLGMAAYCYGENLNGFAAWLRHQAEEELEHALKFFDHLRERGGALQLPAVEAPSTHYGSVREVFEAALAQEQKITRNIHDLYDLALQERDYAAQVLLQWFVTEQVEEEAITGEMVERLRMAGDAKGALLMLDHQAGKRAD